MVRSAFNVPVCWSTPARGWRPPYGQAVNDCIGVQRVFPMSARAPTVIPRVSAAAEKRREDLVELYRELSDCRKCPLADTRNTVVFGTGNSDADLMFVGEAPGFHEDQQGKPFVGQAGKLLDKLLE